MSYIRGNRDQTTPFASVTMSSSSASTIPSGSGWTYASPAFDTPDVDWITYGSYVLTPDTDVLTYSTLSPVPSGSGGTYAIYRNNPPADQVLTAQAQSVEPPTESGAPLYGRGDDTCFSINTSYFQTRIVHTAGIGSYDTNRSIMIVERIGT